MYTTFYIQVDGGNNVIQYSKSFKPGWLTVSVDKFHLSDFKNDYTDYEYDPIRGGLMPPDGVTTDQEIPNVVQIMSTSNNSGGKDIDVDSLTSNINRKANQKDLTSEANSLSNAISNITVNSNDVASLSNFMTKNGASISNINNFANSNKAIINSLSYTDNSLSTAVSSNNYVISMRATDLDSKIKEDNEGLVSSFSSNNQSLNSNISSNKELIEGLNSEVANNNKSIKANHADVDSLSNEVNTEHSAINSNVAIISNKADKTSLESLSNVVNSVNSATSNLSNMNNEINELQKYKNNQLNMAAQLLTPNLATITDYTVSGRGNFNSHAGTGDNNTNWINIEKGKHYCISAKLLKGNNTYFATVKDGGLNKWSTLHGSWGSTGSVISAQFTAQYTGKFSIGVSTNDPNTPNHLTNIVITQSDNPVSFQDAQRNKAILNILNPSVNASRP